MQRILLLSRIRPLWTLFRPDLRTQFRSLALVVGLLVGVLLSLSAWTQASAGAVQELPLASKNLGHPPQGGLNTALWIWQGVLAGLFLLTGTLKLVLPAAKVRPLAPAFFSLAFLRGLGVVELLGAVGIVVPSFTGIGPVLTAMAAVGMSVVLAAAVVVHTQRRDFTTVPFLLLMLAGALIVAWGRWP